MCRRRLGLADHGEPGGPGALDALVERYWPALLAYVRLHADPVIRRHESCADVALSVCREVLADAARFTFHGEPAFRKWLFQKAAAKLVDHRRYMLRECRDPARERPIAASATSDAWSRLEAVYAAAASPSRVAIGREDLARFEAAFAQLPPDQQRVIVAARLEGQSHAAIAAELGKSDGAVRVLLHRALARVGLSMEAARTASSEPPEPR